MAFRFPGVCSFFLLLVSGAALAADPLTDAIQLAYAPYRVALFKTNGKSQTESRDAVLLARAQWAEVTLRHAAQPPVPYAADTQLREDFVRIDAIYARAAEEVDRGQLSPAHETLEQVRDILAELRRRNGVVVFSDHMNAYHSAMEHLIDDGPRLLTEEKGLLRLMARIGTLGYLAQRLSEEATGELKGNREFIELGAAVKASVAELESAVLAGELPRVKQALGSLKKPYSRLFLKFG